MMVYNVRDMEYIKEMMFNNIQLLTMKTCVNGGGVK